jgi:hypothetical protein
MYVYYFPTCTLCIIYRAPADLTIFFNRNLVIVQCPMSTQFFFTFISFSFKLRRQHPIVHCNTRVGRTILFCFTYEDTLQAPVIPWTEVIYDCAMMLCCQCVCVCVCVCVYVCMCVCVCRVCVCFISVCFFFIYL